MKENRVIESGDRVETSGETRLRAARTIPRAWLAVSTVVLMTAAGCASVPLFGSKTVKYDRADAKNPAVQILTLWTVTDGPGPNGVPVRGFAGQIYFFTQAKSAPVIVDGKVRIYLFDDRGTVKQQSRPIAEFDIDPAGWNGRAHSSTLGPGYAVFVPYPRNDFHQATCSLRVRFTPTVGPTIYSPPASVVLSGPPTTPAHGDETVIHSPPPQARQAGPQNASSAPAAPGGLSTSEEPISQSVIPVAGTQADARLSLADDEAASEVTIDGPASVSDGPSAPRSHRIKLESANADRSDPDEN